LNERQMDALEKLNYMQDKLTNTWLEYWQRYSLGTWQFWVSMLLLVLPLVILYFALNRRRALLLGFYGYTVHVLFTYIDAYGTSHSLWSYPFKVLPGPTSFALDVSFIPVAYMLVYQWALRHDKNYYLCATVLSGFLALVFKPIMTSVGMFLLHKGTTNLHLFIGYIVITLVAKWVTNLYLYLLKENDPFLFQDIKTSLRRTFQGKIKAR